MLNLALFGPPGAGKGTQSEFIIKKFNLFYISTGDILRKEISEKTAIGLEAQNIIVSGGLVPDETIMQIIENTIHTNIGSNGFLFDGFPRTINQADLLDRLLLKLDTSLDCFISLNVEQEEAVKRLLNRGKTSGRSDDNEVSIRNRLNEYYEKTMPVMNYYKNKGIYFEVNGLNTIEKVSFDINHIIESL
jgi:adenylate kinase